MTISPSRTYEQIKQQVGKITGQPPGAWWVGTDETLAMRDSYFATLDTWREQARTLATEYECNPDKNWVNRWGGGALHLIGFTPNDLDNPHKALRHKTGHPSKECFVPNRRTKLGKELDARLDALSKSTAPSLDKEFSGYEGQIMKPMGDGRFWRTAPSVTTHEDTYPFLTIGENPDDNPYAEGIAIDPELWERIPTSWIMRIIEESAEQ